MRFVLPPLQRRAIIIYLLTVVLPVCGLLGLGLHAFDLQRQALATLRAEKLAAAIDAYLLESARQAFAADEHPMVLHRIDFAGGALHTPSLHAPLRASVPTELAAPYNLETRDPAAALSAYERLLRSSRHPSLVLNGMARCLEQLQRTQEARAVWGKLAREYPNDRDLSHRPFGIVAAIRAGQTDGLAERIASNRWELSADQAEYFLNELAPGSQSKYLDRFRVARDLERRFRVPDDLQLGEVRHQLVAAHHLFVRTTSSMVAEVIVADPAWLSTVPREVEVTLGMTDRTGREFWPFAAVIGVVSLLLSAGLVLLWRDVGREARVNQLRAEFVSGVSHELKTPITLVKLYGETLLRHDTLSPAERRDFYRVITRESSRLGRLVDQVLAFGRVDRGEFRYDLKEGDLLVVINGVLDDYRDWFEHGGFTVATSVPESIPPVRFDASAISQILVNLLDNAVKYSGDAREIGVRVSAEGHQVYVDVQDRGPGIGRADQARIFDRFYRAAAASGKGGSGLGLYMVQQIMSAHDGRVEVDSQPGAGSRFRLVFPAATP